MIFLVYSHETQQKYGISFSSVKTEHAPSTWEVELKDKWRKKSKSEAWALLGRQDSHSSLEVLCCIMWRMAWETKTQIHNFSLLQRRAVTFAPLLVKRALPFLQGSTITSKELWADMLLIDARNTSQSVKSHIYISESNLLPFLHEINSVAIE